MSNKHEHLAQYITSLLIALSTLILFFLPIFSTFNEVVGASGSLSCAQPPDFQALGIDPASISLAELKQYGLPPKPLGLDSISIAEWKSAILHAKHRICDGAPGTGSTNIYNYGGVNYTTDPKWSGWAAFPSSTFGLYTAVAEWNAPCIPSNGYIHANSTSSHWVGLGGTRGQQLLQVGTVSNEDSSGHPYYKAWVENTGPLQSQPEQDKFNIHCGDHMYGYAQLPYIVDIQDFTSGEYFYGYDGSVSPSTLSWECISEWQHNVPLHEAADFNYTTYKYCHGEDYYGNVETIYDTSVPANITAIDDGGYTIIWAGSLNSEGSGFTTHWVQPL